MKRGMLLLACALFIPLTAHADPRTCRGDDAGLRAMLAERHAAPSIARIRAACSDASRALIDVATTGRQIERMRAIALLAEFPEAHALLARLTTDDSPSIRRIALLTLARTSDTGLLVRTARASLGDADPHVRVAAIRVLTPHASARADLERIRSAEPEAFVREAIDAALATPTTAETR